MAQNKGHRFKHRQLPPPDHQKMAKKKKKNPTDKKKSASIKYGVRKTRYLYVDK